MKRHLSLILCLVFLSGCVGAAVSPAGRAFSPEEDEKRLWLAAEKEEKVLDSSGVLYRSSELDRYLDSVLRKLVPAETLSALPMKISVIRNPYLNAFAFPNGRIYIHEGMLVQMENEAQLATVIGHEMTHAIHRHGVQELRNAKNKTAFFAALNSLTVNVLAPIGELGAFAAIQGYSREMERDADDEGLRRLIAAGYDPAEAPKIFSILQREVQEEKISEPFFFGSHPRLQERIDSYQTLLQTTQAGKSDGVVNAEIYRGMITPLYLDNALLDLKRGSFEAARRDIGKFVAAKGEDSKALFLLGETWRQSGQSEGVAKAREYYLKSAALDPANPEPHRALGLIAYKSKETELADRSLKRYLTLAPQAADRRYIEEMLKNLH